MVNPEKPFLVVGSGGHSVSCLALLADINSKVSYIYDPFSECSHLKNIPIIQSIRGVGSPKQYNVCIAIGENFKREDVLYSELSSIFSLEQFPVIQHPSAVVSKTSRIGPGTVIMPGVVIAGYCEVGMFCIINTSASLDHESCMQNFSSLAPGSRVGGRSKIESRSAICIGATVSHSLRIGFDTIIGAGAVQLQDADPLSIYYGNPSKYIRRRFVHSPYLSIPSI